MRFADFIVERQNAVEFLLNPAYRELRRLLHTSVKAMKDTEKLMTRIQVYLLVVCADAPPILKECWSFSQNLRSVLQMHVLRAAHVFAGV